MPSPEKESGVTFTTPITDGRGNRSSIFTPPFCSVPGMLRGLLAASVATLVAAVSAGAAQPAKIKSCLTAAVAPKTLILACADANYQLITLRWTDWGQASAKAHGLAYANDCNPYCAAGHFHSYPVAVTADELTKCGAARYYARLTIQYMSMRPAGIAQRDVHKLGC